MVLSGDSIKKGIDNGLIEDAGELIIDKKTNRIFFGDTYYDQNLKCMVFGEPIFDESRHYKVSFLDTVRANVGPNGLDVRVSNHFREFRASSTECIDLYTPPECVDMEPTKDGAFIIQPGKFCLATIMEHIYMPNDVMGKVDARSSVGRRGLLTQTATIIQAGWNGYLTLEIKNESSMAIKIYPGDKLSQVVFHRLDIATSNPYDGIYQSQTIAEPLQ